MPIIKHAASDALKLELPSSFDHLERVIEETEAFMAEASDDEDLNYKVVLLVSEAVTNAIEHGNELDAAKRVWLTVATDDSSVTIRVEDEGKGFDPDEVENPLDQDNLLREGGRGLFLMEAMASEIRYENEGRRLVMVLRRADAGAS